MSQKVISQLLGIEPFEGNRLSTIYLAINSARFFAKNNLFIHEYYKPELEDILTEKALNYEFLFSGLLNYMIFIEQIGGLLGKSIETVINEFFPKEFSKEELKSIYQFRNSFAHRFSLATEKKGEYSRKFRLDFHSLENVKPVIEAYPKWEGNNNVKNDETDTIINVKSFIQFCEEFNNRVVSENINNKLTLKIPVDEIMVKYTIK